MLGQMRSFHQHCSRTIGIHLSCLGTIQWIFEQLEDFFIKFLETYIANLFQQMVGQILELWKLELQDYLQADRLVDPQVGHS